MNTRSTDTVLVTSIEVEPTSRAMNIGDSNFLFATVYPSNATNKTVRWSSSNTYVATVDQNGGLVMVNGNGVAFITATACDGSGVSSSCVITVGDVWIQNIAITPQSFSLNATT